MRDIGLYRLDSPNQLGKSWCWKGMSNVFASKNNHFAPICSANAAQRPKLDVCGCKSKERTCTPSKTFPMINKGETSTATGSDAPPVFALSGRVTQDSVFSGIIWGKSLKKSLKVQRKWMAGLKRMPLLRLCYNVHIWGQLSYVYSRGASMCRHWHFYLSNRAPESLLSLS